eukprot:2455360-Rhodomonas_salina.2
MQILIRDSGTGRRTAFEARGHRVAARRHIAPCATPVPGSGRVSTGVSTKVTTPSSCQYRD